MAVIRNLVVKIGADISGLSKGLKQAQTKLEAVSKSIGNIGSSLSLRVTAPLVAMGTLAVKTAGDFEQSMANAASVSNATGEELNRMKEIARKMGKETVFSAAQAADAMYYMASAGYKVEQMADSIAPILNLAAATQSDLAFTTDTVIATLNQFGLDASDAERVTNVFAATIGYSQATLDKLAYSMRYVGPVANSLGYSVEETSAALGLLYNSGFKGEQAGTVLRGALSRLLKPTKAINNVLQEMGLTYDDVNPSTKNLAEIIGTLEKVGISTSQAVKLFGQEAGPGMMALISQGSDALKDMTQQITGTNSASEMAEKQLDTLQGSYKLLTSMLEEVAISIGNMLIPMIRNFMEKSLMPLIERFNNLSDAGKGFALKIAGIAAAIGPVLMVLSNLFKVGAVVLKVLAAVATPVGLIVTAVGLLIGACVYLFKTNEKFRNKVLKIWETIKGGIVNAISVITQWWNSNGQQITDTTAAVFIAVMEGISFAVAAIITAFQNLIGWFSNLWQTNDTFRNGVVSVWNTIKNAVTETIAAIKAWWEANGQKILDATTAVFNTILSVISSVLTQIFTSIGVFFSYVEPIWEQLKVLFASLWQVMEELYKLLEPIFIAIGAVVAVAFAAVVGVINGVIQALGPLIQAFISLAQFITDVVGAIVALFNGDLAGAWQYVCDMGQHLAEFFENLWQGILNYISGFVDGFCSFFEGLGIDVVEIVKGIVQDVGDWFSNLWQDIEDFCGDIWDSITGIFNDIGTFIDGIIKSAWDWGSNLIDSIIEGINSAVTGVTDAISGIGDEIKNFLGFESPTKKGEGRYADEWMPNMMGMFSRGITDSLPLLQRSVAETMVTIGQIGSAKSYSGINSGETNNQTDIANGFMQALQANNLQKGNAGEQPIELTIDGQVFARVVLPSLLKEFKRKGLVVGENNL